MTPEQRIAAALAQGIHQAICPQLGRPCSGAHAPKDAAAILATKPMQDLLADPTLICPDPEAHALADAVRRLTDAVAWAMEGGPDGEPSSVWNSHGYEAKGATLQAALTAALEDKP